MKILCKKTIACLLAALMLCAALPFTAFAGGDGEDIDPALRWDTYITSVEYPADKAPMACVTVTNYHAEYTAWYIPNEYIITLKNGETINMTVDNDVEDPADGLYFDVPVADGVALKLTAWMYYDPDENDVIFVISQIINLPDNDIAGLFISETPVGAEVEIDEVGSFFSRIIAWFVDLFARIRAFFTEPFVGLR
ncbi:MAG: hypothetical protein IJK64_02200 [Clostridia bacterium]|nr:hypothetical protein [Clostridia bacterium]